MWISWQELGEKAQRTASPEGAELGEGGLINNGYTTMHTQTHTRAPTPD